VRETIIQDKNGKHYNLRMINEDNRGYHLSVTQDHYRVGEIKCNIQDSGVMNIGDIEIYDNIARSKPGILWFIPWKVWKRLTKKNFRGRGLGSLLLELAINYARRRGLRQIRGFVVRKDLAATPWLLDWYSRYGFQIIPNDNHEPSNAVAWIIRDR
jgi:GNAT superfamily N-acetyltransferase